MTDLPPDPVTGLASEVEALARTVADLAPLPALVQRLSQAVAHIAQHSAQQTDTDRTGAVSWLAYDGDTDTAETILNHLTRWVAGVYLRYSDAPKTFPHCWLWHPDVVEELLWLRGAWLHAYSVHARPT
ncbi:MAG: hypothetical protein LC749_01830, partial [Actinobacteria bacterium]|nr:hypothetical protein [Actinomycetota bacterium]